MSLAISFQDHFTMICSQGQPLLTVSCQYEREPPSPRLTPWGAYRSHASSSTQIFLVQSPSLLPFTHTLTGVLPLIHEKFYSRVVRIVLLLLDQKVQKMDNYLLQTTKLTDSRQKSPNFVTARPQGKVPFYQHRALADKRWLRLHVLHYQIFMCLFIVK